MVSNSDGSDLHPALDDVDRAIVHALRRDGRMSMRALAQELHISRAATYTRVQRLESAGVITGYSATIDPERYGHGVSAYVYLKIAQRTWKPLRDRLMHIGQVEHAALVSGGTDIVLLVRARDVRALRDLVLERLHTMPEVISTESVMIFDEAVGVPQSGPAG
jgi:DNA-binding Lrp family transcriptional regulator